MQGPKSDIQQHEEIETEVEQPTASQLPPKKIVRKKKAPISSTSQMQTEVKSVLIQRKKIMAAES